MLSVNLSSGVVSQSSLAGYISYVQSIPVLTESEEKFLLSDFIENKNQVSGKKVAEAHLRIVVKIAMEFRKYCNSVWDMISEGNIGLLKALKNFSLEKNVRFVTYATLWVRASIQEFVLRASSNLKISIGQMQKKILFNLGKVKLAIGRYSQKQCTTKEIARILEVPESELVNLTSAISMGDASLDAPQGEDGFTKGDMVACHSPTPEDTFLTEASHAETNGTILQAFKALNEREKVIITQRFLAKNQATLQQLATQFKISVERVRQIESSAIKKMKKLLENNAQIKDGVPA